MADQELQKRLVAFVAWSAKHITGDEKGQAQIFLDRLFQALGQPGSLDVGGSPEMRVRKAVEDGGGTSFADYVWKPVVLVEMKKRGVSLAKHYRQAFDYWVRLVPGRPRYVILCNFDEFWIFDFETQMDAPVAKFGLAELPMRHAALGFLLPKPEPPEFDNDRVAVTRDAADALAACFNAMLARGVERSVARRFTLQMLVALFSEDIGLLEKDFVTKLLAECTESSSYDLLGGLFHEMNQPGPTPGGRFKGVPYFNGGLFASPAKLELTDFELGLLRDCAVFNWSMVQPEIFGTLFERSMGEEERHAQGAHFTHPTDIMKIVGPTIVEPWRERIAEAKTLRRLRELSDRMALFRVLDPACGSGNFLYIAYRELKRLEASIFERMEQEFKREARQAEQLRMSFVSAQSFFGIDINPFAIEIAKTTMVIARKLAIDELHIVEQALPLDNLDANFQAVDALMFDAATRTPWPRADVIIGNPPFLGTKLMKPELGRDYVDRLRRLYPEVPGMADHCVYWFYRAHHHLPPCTAAEPTSGRAGLVGTQNIRNNESRVGGLDVICADGAIVEAVDVQPWSGEAGVSVSIVDWVKTQDPALLPKRRRLWSVVTPQIGPKGRRRKGTYDLVYRDVDFINSSLSDDVDVSGALTLGCNVEPKRVFQGVTPGHAAFVLTDEEKAALERDGVSGAVIHPYLIGDELISGAGTPERHIIDFQRRSVLEAGRFTRAFARVRDQVLPAREAAAAEDLDEAGRPRPHHAGFLDRWWCLSWDRADMFSALERLRGRFVACSRLTKRPIFVFVSNAVWPSEQVQVFLFDDDYSFGVLQSAAHWEWFRKKSSKYETRPRYSTKAVFNTFPWPQTPSSAAVRAVARAGREVRRVRDEALASSTGGLRALYRTLDLPGANPLKAAHRDLDEAVRSAYGFPPTNLLQNLLDLNRQVAAAVASGGQVVGPGVPPTFKDRNSLITTDCAGVE